MWCDTWYVILFTTCNKIHTSRVWNSLWWAKKCSSRQRRSQHVKNIPPRGVKNSAIGENILGRDVHTSKKDSTQGVNDTEDRLKLIKINVTRDFKNEYTHMQGYIFHFQKRIMKLQRKHWAEPYIQQLVSKPLDSIIGHWISNMNGEGLGHSLAHAGPNYALKHTQS